MRLLQKLHISNYSPEFVYLMAFYVDLYSDLKVKVAGKMLSAHKFVLAARSDAWSLANLASTTELDLSGERSWGDGTPSMSLKNENSIVIEDQIVLTFKIVLCHFCHLITVCILFFFFF